MGIVSISYIEAVLGSDISTDDEPRVQKYIDIVSAYIERYTGRTFSLHEGAVLRAVADGKGIIEIPDLTAVTLVELRDSYNGTYGDVTSGLPFAFNSGYYGYDGLAYGFAYDGVGMIYGLRPRAAYQITCDYGVEAPEDIKGVVADLVLAGSGLDTTSREGLKSYRVGDVEETYGVSSGGNVSLTGLMETVLDLYSTGNTTYRL